MSFKKIHKIPTKQELFDLLPLSQNLKNIKQKNDQQIKNILSSKSDKMLVVIGPCSVHDEKAIFTYLDMLYKINQQTKEKLFIIPRIYTSKPRTTGKGYKGMLHQHNFLDTPSIKNGIFAVRNLDLKIIQDYGFAIADEMLYTSTYPYIDDLLSYVAVGARSVENQEHRLFASGINCAVGIKNPMCGNLSVMFNAINTAQNGHNFMYDGFEVETEGNFFCHGILRGFVDNNNNHFSNYSYDNLLKAIELYENENLKNKSLIIDTNHSNSGKIFDKQKDVVKDVVNSIKKDSSIKKIVKGFMIESFIEEGSDENGTVFGKSVTDPCIGIEETKKILFDLADKL